MHFNTITILPSLPVSIKCCDGSRSVIASAALDRLHTDETEREWIYDTGAATSCIDRELLTDDEKSRVYNITPIKFITANGLNVCPRAVGCNIPFLCKRQAHVLKGSPAATSATETVMHYGVTLTYSRDIGASITLPGGSVVYLEERNRVPTLDGQCKTENAWRPSKMTEKSKTWNTAAYMCSSCRQAPWLGTEANFATTTSAMAANTKGDAGDSLWSEPIPPPKRTTSTGSTSARERSELCPERQRDGKTPNLQLPRTSVLGMGTRQLRPGQVPNLTAETP